MERLIDCVVIFHTTDSSVAFNTIVEMKMLFRTVFDDDSSVDLAKIYGEALVACRCELFSKPIDQSLFRDSI